MHPFWAVRRLTKAQLDEEAAQVTKRNLAAVAGSLEPVPSFNCELQDLVQNNCAVCKEGTQTLPNVNRQIKLPMMMNTKPLERGEELILEIRLEPKQKDKKRTWQDVDREQQAAKRSKCAAASPEQQKGAKGGHGGKQ